MASLYLGFHGEYLCVSTDLLYFILLPFGYMPIFRFKFAINITDQENMQLRVYLRTYALDQMVQAASSSAGLRTIKRVEQTLQDLGVRFILLTT